MLTGVNFINILHETFLYKSALCSFSLIGLVIFWQKIIGAKGARKMLMKLTTGGKFFGLHRPFLLTVTISVGTSQSE